MQAKIAGIHNAGLITSVEAKKKKMTQERRQRVTRQPCCAVLIPPPGLREICRKIWSSRPTRTRPVSALLNSNASGRGDVFFFILTRTRSSSPNVQRQPVASASSFTLTRPRPQCLFFPNRAHSTFVTRVSPVERTPRKEKWTRTHGGQTVDRWRLPVWTV